MSFQLEEVALRAFEVSDAEQLAGLLNNRKIWGNLRDYIPFPYNVENAQEFIALSQKEHPRGTFAIAYQETLCGVISLNRQKDVYRMSVEVGYWIGEPFWGKGIATKALKLAVQYGFSKLGFERIFAATYAHNHGSSKVLEKCGFKKEGVLRKAVFKNGKYLDEIRYGLLREEYKF